MRKKIFFASATVLFALMTIFSTNIDQKTNNGNTSLENIIIMASANPEYPHYGSYGRDTWDCSTTITVTAGTTVCWKGICIDSEFGGTYEVSCTNCAWDCNTNGANNTCDPESC